MTKIEYIQKLQEKLDNFSKELREDILEDYNQHFAEGELQGKTDEEIIEELGNIEDIVRELSESELWETMGCGLPGTEGASKISMQDASRKNMTAAFGAESTEGGDGEKSQENSAQEDLGAQAAKPCDSGLWIGSPLDYSGKYNKIVLEGEDADIYVKPSEDGEMHVEYINQLRNGQEKYEYYQYDEDDIFYAGIRKRVGRSQCRTGVEGDEKSWKVMLLGKTVVSYKNIGNAGNGRMLALCVSVPKGVQELSAKASSGDVHIEDLVQENMLLESDSGDVNVEKVLANVMRIHTSSGDVTVCDTKCCRCLNASASSGDVNILNVVMKEEKAVSFSQAIEDEAGTDERELIAKSSSGDVNIKNVTAEKIDASSSSGDTNLKNVTVTASNVRSSSGDVSINHIGCSGTLQVGSTSGDLAVANVKAEVFNVSCSSGDVAIASARFTAGDIEASRGDMAIADMEFTSGDFKTNSGDMAIANLRFITGDFVTEQGDIAISNTNFQSGVFVANNGDIAGNQLSGEFGSFVSGCGDIALRDQGEGCCRGYRCTTEDGDISIESYAEIYECRTRSGDISVHAFGSPRKLTIESKDGDVFARAKGTPESVDVESGSGDVRLKLEETEGMEAEIKANGDAYVKWDGQKRNVRNGSYTYGTGACKVKAVSRDGDVVVSGFPE